MGLWSRTKKLIYKLDFFYTAEVLRFEGQNEYRTLLGGVFSISIIVLLLATFSNKVFSTFSKVIISSTTSITNADDPLPYNISTDVGEPFMMGVEIWELDLNNQNKRYFDVRLEQVVYDSGFYNANASTIVPLQPCTLEHWASYPNIQKSYDRLGIGKWLCLPLNQQFEIKGKYASVISQTLEVTVSGCTNSTQWTTPCAPQTQIDQLFVNLTNFYFTIYFVNPLINADSQQYLSHYLEDSNYIMFSSVGGEQCQILMQGYEIQTDQSIVPVSQTQISTDGIVTKNCIKNRFTVDQNSPLYASFQFYKSPITRKINRSFQKIDEILSYIGGLFGTIAICLYLISLYNGYSFEILMGGYLFKPDDENMNKQLKKYNFFYFLLHLVYYGFDIIGFQLPWPTTRLFYECKDQMVKQLDILYLFRRITILERGINSLLTDKQILALRLMDNKTLLQAKKERRKSKWDHDVFMKKVRRLNKFIQLDESDLHNRDKNQRLDSEFMMEQNKKPVKMNKISNSSPMLRKNETQQTGQTSILDKIQEALSSDSNSEDDTQEIIKQITQFRQQIDQQGTSKNIWGRLTRNIRNVVEKNIQHVQITEQPFLTHFQSSEMLKNNSFQDGQSSEIKVLAKPRKLPKIQRKFERQLDDVRQSQKEESYPRQQQKEISRKKKER